MSTVNDIIALEAGDFESELDAYLALQRTINAGVWSLQGSFGRSMMAAIESGNCMLGPNAERDYYGNQIPARTDVKPGTKGSREFVVARRGEDWAAALDAA